MTVPAPVPATLVIGLAGAGKSTFIRAQLAARPAAESWLWLNNDLPLADSQTDSLTDLQADSRADLRTDIADLTVGCACCAALPVLRTRLPRWLAARPRHRLLIEMAAAGDPAAMIDALRMPELARWLQMVQVVLVADARRLSLYADQPGGSAVELLARRQLQAADSVWLTDHQRLPAAAMGPLVRRLAAAPPFGRRVHLAGLPDLSGAAGTLQAPRPPRFEQRWPAIWRFDRRRLLALFDSSSAWPDELGMNAVFATERAWYQLRRQDRQFSMEVSAYRSENRLQVFPERASSTDIGSGAAAITRADDELARWLRQRVADIDAARLS